MVNEQNFKSNSQDSTQVNSANTQSTTATKSSFFSFLFSFKGRIRRSDYWLVTFFVHSCGYLYQI